MLRRCARAGAQAAARAGARAQPRRQLAVFSARPSYSTPASSAAQFQRVSRWSVRPFTGTGQQQQEKKQEQEDQKQKESEEGKEGENPYDDEEEKPSKAKEIFSTIVALAIVGLVGVCSYFVVTELFPSKLSPNAIFARAFETVEADADVANHYGTPLKAYGRDGGGHREGRRNFVEHEEYTAPDDGSKRVRVRFNLKGPYGHAFVYAECSNKMPAGEYVYLMVQDTSTGHVITIHDNRAALMAEASGASREEQDALSRLLGRGRA